MDAYRAFVERLVALPESPGAFNPYAGGGPAAVRRDNLALYLARMAAHRPRLLLVGEAPGYRGCGVTGVPFTSEAVLLGEPSPFELFGATAGFRASDAASAPRREATATVLWTTLVALDCLPLLWNACPLHPHRPGEQASNRPPTAAEVMVGRPFVETLLALYRIERVVAVGRKAAAALDAWGIAAAAVRHPGHGGKAAFVSRLEELGIGHEGSASECKL